MKITNRKYFCIDFGAKTSVIPNLAIILFCVWINQDLWEHLLAYLHEMCKKKEVPSVKGTREKKELMRSKGARKEGKNYVQRSVYDVRFLKSACESFYKSGRTMSIGLELLHEDFWKRTKHGQQSLDDTCFISITKWETGVVNKKFNSKVVPISLFPILIKVLFESSNLQTSIEMVLVENFLEGKKIFYDCHTSNPKIWEVNLLMLWSTSIFYLKHYKIVQHMFKLVEKLTTT